MANSSDTHLDSKLAPQQKRSREARDRIMVAAEELLRREGVDGFSMAGVGEAAGLPVGNIYRRFEGRDDLLQAIKEVVAARIRDAVFASVHDGGHRDLAEFVKSFTLAIGDAFSRDEMLHRALFDPRVESSSMLVTGKFTKSTNFGLFLEGIRQYMPKLSEERLTAAAKVAFSIVVNAVLQKVRGVDVVLMDMEWDDLISEFGAAATSYLGSVLSRS